MEVDDGMLIADNIQKTPSSTQLLSFTRITHGLLRFHIPKSIVELLTTKEDNESLLDAFLVNDYTDEQPETVLLRYRLNPARRTCCVSCNRAPKQTHT